ncbi:hypothetical protein M885DRAFT_503790 [Pelagophyceae sp. CCMP2097]|nr:hypothetical protein M885DRAFT_503790 [Pelagophyceae sp. CCMP2097]
MCVRARAPAAPAEAHKAGRSRRANLWSLKTRSTFAPANADQTQSPASLPRQRPPGARAALARNAVSPRRRFEAQTEPAGASVEADFDDDATHDAATIFDVAADFESISPPSRSLGTAGSLETFQVSRDDRNFSDSEDGFEVDVSDYERPKTGALDVGVKLSAMAPYHKSRRVGDVVHVKSKRLETHAGRVVRVRQDGTCDVEYHSTTPRTPPAPGATAAPPPPVPPAAAEKRATASAPDSARDIFENDGNATRRRRDADGDAAKSAYARLPAQRLPAALGLRAAGTEAEKPLEKWPPHSTPLMGNLPRKAERRSTLYAPTGKRRLVAAADAGLPRKQPAPDAFARKFARKFASSPRAGLVDVAASPIDALYAADDARVPNPKRPPLPPLPPRTVRPPRTPPVPAVPERRRLPSLAALEHSWRRLDSALDDHWERRATNRAKCRTKPDDAAPDDAAPRDGRLVARETIF